MTAVPKAALRGALSLFAITALALLPQAAQAARAYVSNEDDGTVSVVDTQRREQVASVAVGKRPRGLVLSKDGTQLYVAVSGLPKCPPPITDEQCAKLPRDPAADGVAVVDTATLKQTRLIKGVSDPERVEISPDGKTLYVTDEDSARVTVLDVERGKVLANIAVGREPEGVRLAPNGRWLLVTSENDDNVAIIDVRTHKVLHTVVVGKRPRDVAFTADGRTAYVSGEGDASVYKVALPSGTPAAVLVTLRKDARPMGLLLDLPREQLYVSTGRGGTVAVITPADGKLVREVPVGARPWGIALTPDGRRLITANGPSGDVAIVDTDTFSLLGKVAVGHGPWGVVTGP
ncbi:MAG TPA: beta-propeller fold lactonase family protein [Steroidobacteraceae bacterium]|nr:beta-propeller fold lactonase family protein [Steroidobacteraceae bacterium]